MPRFMGSIKGAQLDVFEFIHKVKGEDGSTQPGVFVSEAKRDLSIRLINEEYHELIEALDNNNMVEIIDGGIDLIYVVLYMFCMCGVDAEFFWREVQRSNMAKAGGPKDPVTGKQLKPPGWTPPDIAGILAAHAEHVADLRRRLGLDGERTVEP